MIQAVTFTYAGDATLIPAWCELHRAVGLAPVIVEDAAAPLPSWVLAWLTASRIRLHRSRFPRRGNLNGTDCAAGIAATLAAIAATTGARAILKIDTDAAVVCPSVFAAVTDGPAAIAGLVHPAAGRHDAFGMAYALTASAAAAIAAYLHRQPLDPAAPEDRTIWRAAKALKLPACALPFGLHSGPFTVVPPWADPADAVARYSVLTWGNQLPSCGRSTHHILTGLRRTQQALRHDYRTLVNRVRRSGQDNIVWL